MMNEFAAVEVFIRWGLILSAIAFAIWALILLRQ